VLIFLSPFREFCPCVGSFRHSSPRESLRISFFASTDRRDGDLVGGSSTPSLHEAPRSFLLSSPLLWAEMELMSSNRFSQSQGEPFPWVIEAGPALSTPT